MIEVLLLVPAKSSLEDLHGHITVGFTAPRGGQWRGSNPVQITDGILVVRCERDRAWGGQNYKVHVHEDVR